MPGRRRGFVGILTVVVRRDGHSVRRIARGHRWATGWAFGSPADCAALVDPTRFWVAAGHHEVAIVYRGRSRKSASRPAHGFGTNAPARLCRGRKRWTGRL